MKRQLGTLGMPPRSFGAIREKKILSPDHVNGGVGVHAGGKNEILAKSARAISNFML